MTGADIRTLDDVLSKIASGSRLLCLYSGGLDGSWLLAQVASRGAPVTALHVDLGGEPLSANARKACGALGIDLRSVDSREKFATEFVAPAIAAQARYLGGHPISASLSRPLISQVAVEIASQLRCDCIIHTADRSQNSLRRFNGALKSLGFKGHYGSPFAASRVTRDEKRCFLESHGIAGYLNRTNSRDSTLWGSEFEAGDLDNPEQIVPRPDLLPERDNAFPGALQIGFEAGLPSILNGRRIPLHHLLVELAELISGCGIGRYVWLEELEGGEKVQEVHDMPAATLLLDAYRRLESACISAESIREKMHLEQIWVREAVEGRWYESLRAAAQAFIMSIAVRVTGNVTYQIGPGEARITGVKAERPLYVRNREDLNS